MKVRGIHIVLILGMLVAIFGSYSNHWDNTFHFDDRHTIQTNTHIRSLDNWKSFFTDSKTYSALPLNTSYRPLCTLSVAIDAHFSGDGEELDPFYFHLTNFGGHLLLTFLLIILFYYWLPVEVSKDSKLTISILGAALFGVHAMGPETITYISSRSDSLSTLWSVITLLVFILFPKWRKYQLFMVPFFIAFLFKQTAIVIPLLIFFYLVIVENAKYEGSFSQAFMKAFMTTIPSLIMAVGLYVFNTKMTPDTFAVGEITPFQYAISQPFVITRYFTSFFLPFDLSADTDWKTISSIFDFRFLVGFIFLVLSLLTIVRMSIDKKLAPLSYALLWFFICVAPTSSILPLAEVMNDHRVYFSNVALSFALVYAIYLTLNYFRGKGKKPGQDISVSNNPIFIGLCAIIILANAFGTYQRNEVWENSNTLWKDVTLKSPRNPRGLMNYGLTLVEEQPWLAMAYYDASHEMQPIYVYLHINYGVLKSRLGYPSRDIEYHYEKALFHNYPGNPDPYFYYSNWLLSKYRIAEAKIACKQALEISPNHAGAIRIDRFIKNNYPTY